MKEAGYLVENKASVPVPFILRCGPERTMSYSYENSSYLIENKASAPGSLSSFVVVLKGP